MKAEAGAITALKEGLLYSSFSFSLSFSFKAILDDVLKDLFLSNPPLSLSFSLSEVAVCA